MAVVVALRTGLLDERVVEVWVGRVRRGRVVEEKGWERRVGVRVWMSMPEMERRLSWEVERWKLWGRWVVRGEDGSSVLGSEKRLGTVALSGKIKDSFPSRIRP